MFRKRREGGGETAAEPYRYLPELTVDDMVRITVREGMFVVRRRPTNTTWPVVGRTLYQGQAHAPYALCLAGSDGDDTPLLGLPAEWPLEAAVRLLDIGDLEACVVAARCQG